MKNQNEAYSASKLESVLGWAAAICIGLGTLSFFVILVVAAIQSTQELVGGSYQAIAWVGYVGIPTGFVLLFTLLFITTAKRKRAQKTGGKKSRLR